MRRYGLIGYPLSHSFSKDYFKEKFSRENINDCIYSNYTMPFLEEMLPFLLANPELRGLNVTIPYKRRIIPFLDVQTPVVKEIGACNCIKIGNRVLTGYNTDVVGFEKSLVPHLAQHHRHALILGTGGAARAVEWVLGRLDIGWLSVSRNPRPGTGDIGYDAIDAGLLSTHTLIVNTTPLGMYPHTEECPPLPYEVLGPQHYLFDLIYNPARTLFLQKGETRGATVENGHRMLVLQAEESWRIWNDPGPG